MVGDLTRRASEADGLKFENAFVKRICHAEILMALPVPHPNGVKMGLAVKKLPPDVLAFFKKQGAKGGRIGGKRALETMTPTQRVARATKASAAAARKRSAKKAK